MVYRQRTSIYTVVGTVELFTKATRPRFAGFREGDEITSIDRRVEMAYKRYSRSGSQEDACRRSALDTFSWHKKRITVRGESLCGKFLWCTVYNSEGTNPSPGWADDPKRLVLLKRPGWRFKVGSKVRAVAGPAEGRIGKVIVLNPQREKPQYLVKFKSWGKGGDSRRKWREPWYPYMHKTRSKSRLWCNESMLRSA